MNLINESDNLALLLRYMIEEAKFNPRNGIVQKIY